MFSFLPLVLIFLSLAVIIFIIGRKIPQLREVGKQRSQVPQLSSKATNSISRFFIAIFSAIGRFFVFIAEWLVKKAKNLLHLVHFWLIKMKRGKKENEMQSEIEAKQELIMEEEKNLEKIINEDLGHADEATVVRHQTEERIVVAPEKPIMVEQKEELAIFKEEQTQDAKLNQFFGQDKEVLEPEKAKGSFFQRFWKKKSQQEEALPLESEFETPEEEKAELLVSDGVRRIPRERLSAADISAGEERLMKEVVTVKRKPEPADLDDELGVDRRILEKKIIQKITRNPRDPENYRQLGELYIKMKNFVDAEESYKQILKITPRDIDAKRKLEKIKLLKRLQ